MIKPISITGGSPTNAPPLLFLMVVSMIKDFYEDSRRRKADLEENNRKILRVVSQGNKPEKSGNLSAVQEELLERPYME